MTGPSALSVVDWGMFPYATDHRLYGADRMVLTAGVASDVLVWGEIVAGSLMATAPPVIVYAFLMD